MKDGRVIEIGPAEAILQRPANAFTQALVAAMPRRLAGRGCAADLLAVAEA
jgi:ABC-type dipeptide/oligopeptide/nickel transport system ATPase component